MNIFKYFSHCLIRSQHNQYKVIISYLKIILLQIKLLVICVWNQWKTITYLI